MIDCPAGCRPSAAKSWPRRILDLFLRKDSCCSEGASCLDKDCSCSCSEMCAVSEWTAKVESIAKPDRPTLNTVPVGGKAYIEQLFLPLAMKKRLLSLGLTSGTKIGVICNEKGRMIIAVRDSRLGLSPEVASKITYKAA